MTLACLVKCMMCLAERRCTISSLWMLAAVCGSHKMAIWHIFYLGWDIWVPVMCMDMEGELFY